MDLMLWINRVGINQEPAVTGIPVWIWVLLGVILIVVILGLVIGAKTSERPSPTIRPTNIQEGSDVSAQQQQVHPEMIPQTGSDVLAHVAEGQSVQDVEGPINYDDLAVIHGVSPDVAQILIDSGIRSFRQLAQTDPSVLKGLMATSDLPYSQVETWPDQAHLAEQGRWDDLEAYRT